LGTEIKTMFLLFEPSSLTTKIKNKKKVDYELKPCFEETF